MILHCWKNGFEYYFQNLTIILNGFDEMFKNRGLGLFLDNDVEEDMRRINFTIPMVFKSMKN